MSADGTQKPSNTDILKLAAQSAMGPMKVALPAQVLSYDRTRQTVTIQPSVCYRDRAADGTETQQCHPPVADVPVQWLGVTWELAAGDTGLAVFCDRAIDAWKGTGNATTEPPDPRRFDLSDAIFLPGVQAPAVALDSAAYADGAVVLWDRGTGDVRLGSSSASDALAKSSTLGAQFTALETAIQAGATAAGAIGDAAQWSAFAAALTAALPGGWPAIAATSTVKAE